MSETDEVGRKKDSGSIVSVGRRVSTVTVILGLLAALFSTLGVIGRGYATRIEVMEKSAEIQKGIDAKQDEKFQEHQRVQNGHLHSIDLQLIELKTEQRHMKEEQYKMRAVLERIENRLK